MALSASNGSAERSVNVAEDVKTNFGPNYSRQEHNNWEKLRKHLAEKSSSIDAMQQLGNSREGDHL